MTLNRREQNLMDLAGEAGGLEKLLDQAIINRDAGMESQIIDLMEKLDVDKGSGPEVEVTENPDGTKNTTVNVKAVGVRASVPDQPSSG